MSILDPHAELRERALTLAINDGFAPRDAQAVIKRAQAYLDFLKGVAPGDTLFAEEYPFTNALRTG